MRSFTFIMALSVLAICAGALAQQDAKGEALRQQFAGRTSRMEQLEARLRTMSWQEPGYEKLVLERRAVERELAEIRKQLAELEPRRPISSIPSRTEARPAPAATLEGLLGKWKSRRCTAQRGCCWRSFFEWREIFRDRLTLLRCHYSDDQCRNVNWCTRAHYSFTAGATPTGSFLGLRSHVDSAWYSLAEQPGWRHYTHALEARPAAVGSTVYAYYRRDRERLLFGGVTPSPAEPTEIEVVGEYVPDR